MSGSNEKDNTITWGYCSGINIGYDFSEINITTDCLILVKSDWCDQIDVSFSVREELDLNRFSPKPFGAWRVKK